MPHRMLSRAVSEKFANCMTAVQDLQDTFSKESEPSNALFDAVRTNLVASTLHMARGMGVESGADQKNLREAMHQLLNMALDDFQYNEQLHKSVGQA